MIFTEHVQAIIKSAKSIVVARNYPDLSPEHIMLALMLDQNDLPKILLQRVGIDNPEIVDRLNNYVSKRSYYARGKFSDVRFSTETIILLKTAQEEAEKRKDEQVSIEHLFLALFRNDNKVLNYLWEQCNINRIELYEKMTNEVNNIVNVDENGNAEVSQSSVLEKYTVDLTELAKHDKLDPVIGRDKEINRTIQILNRRSKNNPVIIGEPGVGKTAIIEGLAQRVVKGDVPESFKNDKILSLDLGGLLAGASYRGEFEERLKSVIKEIEKNAEDYMLFIDEIHTIMGAGATEGSTDAGNLLKPILARGNLRIIGATTLDEYRKYIEKDKAMARRFQPVRADEPTIKTATEILRGLKEKYEKYHGIKITDEAIISAVKLSDRYIADRYLPDKAIDLIDEAASALRIEIDMKTSDKKEINKDDISLIIAKWTGIPVNKLMENESEKLINLEQVLHQRVIGQNEAVEKISNAIRLSRSGLRDIKRPIGTFLFLGPTGVGKTELAKALANVLFNDDDAMIRIDMSEFMEKASVSRLVGTTAGYIGFEEGGQLTEAVRRKPYSVILFDEIEKAHPDVFNIMLQMFDEGRLTDGQGRLVDFKNTVIIMTSNIASEIMLDKKISDENKKTEVTNCLRTKFKPEFLNRIDEIIMFKGLTLEELKPIVEIQINSLRNRLAEQGIGFAISPEAKDFLSREGYEPQYGARPLKRVIRQLVEIPVSMKIIDKTIKEGDVVNIEFQDNKLEIKSI